MVCAYFPFVHIHIKGIKKKYMHVALKFFMCADWNNVRKLNLDCALCSLIKRNLIALPLSRWDFIVKLNGEHSYHDSCIPKNFIIHHVVNLKGKFLSKKNLKLTSIYLMDHCH